jgi:eukaryotic-like serine/threonine-protein kinase
LSALIPGTRLGPYEILSAIGAGGMGEVYRARDARLGRDVAVKIVPPAVAANPDALARFERETRAVAALSHPNILTIHDVGTSDGTTYAVMELLEGQTLRARLDGGALPPRKAVDIAVQMSRGLAAAHDRQIVHRDLKPENVFVTADGSVKILDFGLARQTGRPTVPAADSATMAPSTEPGVVLGTVGYMAPEQVRGEPSDHRADIFALGCVLYELLTGRRPFQRDTAAETMTAILKEDPQDPDRSDVVVAPAVVRTMRRCLEKRPEERFQSARDLAFALESAMETSSASGGRAGTGEPELKFGPTYAKFRPTFGRAIALGFVAGAALAGLVATVMLRQRPAGMAATSTPTFRRLTFDLGTIRDARFMPDGQSVIYSAALNGDPLRLFMTRTDSQESVRLSLPDARVLSISKSGEMAISLGHTFEGWMGMGTLARTSMLGSAPRVLLEQIREAEWSPDGAELAIVRRVGGLEQLEFPAGHVLYKSSGYISDIRFAPDAARIAFTDHPLFADDAGAVSMVDRAGKRTVLWDGFISVRGLAWSADGTEIWFTATSGGVERDAVYAVTPAGRHRVVMASPAGLKLYDIAPDGRALLGLETVDRRVEALLAGSTEPRNVAIRESSTSQWLAKDGSRLTISDQTTARYTAYVLQAGGSAPVELGEGNSYGISPDGRWALALPVTGAPVLLHPTGAGKTRELPNPESLLFDTAAWLPDNRRVVLFGQQAGKPGRGYVQDIDGGAPRPFTAEGVTGLRWWSLPVAPDGSRVIARGEDGVAAFFRLSDGAREVVPGLRSGESPIRFSDDGHALLVARGNGLPWVVERMDIATGRRTPAVEIRARDAAGLRLSILDVTPDGRHWVHSYSRLLTDLFVVKGLK